MTRTIPILFLDTSVIFAAVLSPGGGARRLFQLGEWGLVRLLVGPRVLEECETVVRRKAPQSLPLVALLLEAAHVQMSPAADDTPLQKAFDLVSYRPDAYVLAEALSASPDWFVTHDKAHRLKMQTKESLPFQIGTPGDVLQALAQGF
jgi:predicted nucleic acid-binding protein